MSKYLDNDGLLYLWNSKIKPLFQKAVNKEGDTMTGPLTLSGAPSNDLHAATKKYVDDSVSSAGGGDMLTPMMTVRWIKQRWLTKQRTRTQ